MSSIRSRWIFLCRSLAIILCGLIAANDAYSAMIIGLGSLPGGDGRSWAAAVADNADVVVGNSRSALYKSEAFRWTPTTGMIGLGTLSDVESAAYDVSDDGTIVVGRDKEQAFLWTASTGIMSGIAESTAQAISSDGSVVVGRGYTFGTASFRWTSSSGAQYLGAPPGVYTSQAKAVSGDGSIIVGDAGGQAFRWTSSTGMVRLGTLMGNNGLSSARSISDDGSVIVGGAHNVDEELEAFRWTESSGMIGLGNLGSGSSVATAVSGDGSIIVGQYGLGSSSGTKLFIWDEVQGMRDLNVALETEFGLDLSNWSRFYEITDISADGTKFVGNGLRIDGIGREAFLITIPEANPFLLGSTSLIFGVVASIFRRRRISHLSKLRSSS